MTRVHIVVQYLNLVSYYSFNSYHHHRVLHSFPTRRSSDLDVPRDRQPSSQARHRRGRRPVSAARGHLIGICGTARSEEHTSELQSLTNLVCRLLLEKKKKTERRV